MTKDNLDKLDNIPQVLRKQERWVKFRTRTDETIRKVTKTLLNPHNSKWAKSTDKSSWGSFDKAVMSAERFGGEGVAYALGDGVWCIDLDNCIAPSGEYSELAKSVLSDFKATYAERSVSGRGLHVFGMGELPRGYMSKNESLGLELYGSDRFICMTGDRISDAQELLFCEEQLKNLSEQYLRRPEFTQQLPKQASMALEDDRTLLDKIRASKSAAKFFTLYDELPSKDRDNSSGDFSLCLQLAFWCNRDYAQMDRLFRLSSRMRPKWDERHGNMTYGELTITNAIRMNQNTRDKSYFVAQKQTTKSTPKTPQKDNRQLSFFQDKTT